MKTRKTGWKSHMRSLFKTVSWRLVGAADTFAIAYFITGKTAAAAGVVGFEAITKIVWYYLHERVWDNFGAINDETA